MKNYFKLAVLAFIGMAMNLFNRKDQQLIPTGHSYGKTRSNKGVKTFKSTDKIYRAMKNSHCRFATTKGFALS